MSRYEHFVPVKGHPNYEVSNYGTVINKKNGKQVIPRMNTNGYLRVFIDGKKIYLHRVVADSFFDGDHTGLDVNHKDGDPTNNFLGNLEWCTRKENINHAIRTGLFHRTKRPDADLVEVVRCKDCESRGSNRFCSMTPGDFYCADACKKIGPNW